MTLSEFTVAYYDRGDGWIIGVVEELPSISATGENVVHVRDALLRLLRHRLQSNRSAIEAQMKGKRVAGRERVQPEGQTVSARTLTAPPHRSVCIERAAIHREHPTIRTPFTAVHVRSVRKGAPIISFVPEVPGALSEARTIPHAEANLRKAVGLVLASTFETQCTWWFSAEARRVGETVGEEIHLLSATPLPFRFPEADDGEDG